MLELFQLFFLLYHNMSFTASQRSALEQLHAITASDTDASRERDERLLRQNGWDVQVGSFSSSPTCRDVSDC